MDAADGGVRGLERSIAALEASVDALFAANRHREFFQQAHAIRERFRTARLPHDERERLWARLNRCTEAAKARQSAHFAQRTAENLARWREQLATAESYAANLTREIAEYEARGGTPLDATRWQRRADEKRARFASVQATVAELRRKIGDVPRRT